MEIEFANKRVLELLQTGRSRIYSEKTIKKLSSQIEVLQAATSIHDLWKSPSLHFEKLQGYENRCSIRIDKKYRLEFDIKWTNAEKTMGTIKIMEISKHYE